MEETNKVLLLLIIAAFVVLPVVITLMISLMHKYDDKAKQLHDDPDSQISIGGSLMPQTFFLSILFGFVHSFTIYTGTAVFINGVLIGGALFIVLVSPGIIFFPVMTAFVFLNFYDLVMLAKAGEVSFIPPALAIANIFGSVLFAQHNKAYKKLYSWKRIYNATPLAIKRIIIGQSIEDHRVAATGAYMYEDNSGNPRTGYEGTAFYSVRPYLKDEAKALIYLGKNKSPDDLARAVKKSVEDLDVMAMVAKRDNIYFILIYGAILGTARLIYLFS